MDPNTLNLIIFAEQMAALLAKTVADIRATITGASTKVADDILADADATYDQIIANAKNVQGLVPPNTPPTTPPATPPTTK